MRGRLCCPPATLGRAARYLALRVRVSRLMRADAGVAAGGAKKRRNCTTGRGAACAGVLEMAGALGPYRPQIPTLSRLQLCPSKQSSPAESGRN